MGIPWTSILAAAPALAESARRLLAETRTRRVGAAPVDAASLADRVAALEQRDRETAELVERLTAQNTALTVGIHVLVARVRALMVVAGLAAVLALAALVAVFLS